MTTKETPPDVEGTDIPPKTPDEVASEKKYETVVSSGQHALRALLTINGGGAIIAFLTFIGHLWDKGRLPPAESVSLLVTALQILVAGTFLTVLAYGTIFMTNVFSRYERPKSSDMMFVVTMVLGSLSAMCFLVASLFAVNFFLSVSKVVRPPARGVLCRPKGLRRDIGAIRPADGSAIDEKALELSLIGKRTKNVAVKPLREIDDLLYSVRETNPQLMPADVFRANDSNGLFGH